MSIDRIPPSSHIEISRQRHYLAFAMLYNGFEQSTDGTWHYSPSIAVNMQAQFKGQSVAFAGPTEPSSSIFAKKEDPDTIEMARVLNQPSVIDVLEKFCRIAPGEAVRIIYTLDSVRQYIRSRNLAGRTMTSYTSSEIVDSIARMTLLGQKGSGEAITSAMAMYAISDPRMPKKADLEKHIYQMGEAVSEDPITPNETADLGLSQVTRFLSYETKLGLRKEQDTTDLAPDLRLFDGFPTVGAEFHFPLETARQRPNFYERLAILNLSQYQRGSFVQFSRNDRNVIEVRMNPSYYPVTIANWQHMKTILPELNSAFFTITLNRDSQQGNFKWEAEDKPLLEKLRAVGLLSYAGLFNDIPPIDREEEINFGDIYLGQTVRLENDEYQFTGCWSGGNDGVGGYGQLGLYAGYGDNLPYLAYYLSMALKDPRILKKSSHLEMVDDLNKAMRIPTHYRQKFFQVLQERINARLGPTVQAGNRIIETLGTQ